MPSVRPLVRNPARNPARKHGALKTGRKEESHERIVRAAAGFIRRHGYEGLGVADVMKEAGLTHGGFYAHFGSRDVLLAEAADRAGADSLESLGRAVKDAPPAKALEALIDAYLSDRHLAAPELGCSIAACGAELPRQPAAVRRAATRRIDELIDFIAQQMPRRRGAQGRGPAMGALATLVGAMVIARAVDDPRLARAVRGAAKELLAKAAG
jgi:AcrR family transcriptional regulator